MLSRSVFLTGQNAVKNNNGVFTDQTLALGLSSIPGTSGDYVFGVLMQDLDGDHYPELLVIQDFGRTQLYHNNRDGTFYQAAPKTGFGFFSTSTWGCCLGGNDMGGGLFDINGDGLLDIFTTDVSGYWPNTVHVYHYGNKVHLNLGHGCYKDITSTIGVRDGGWGWGGYAFRVFRAFRADA